MKIGIIGVGMVGTAMQKYFESTNKPLFLYDKFKKIGSPQEVNRADLIFISVPTPYNERAGFDLSAVEDAFSIIRGEKIVVIKSTVLPGTTNKFQKEYPKYKILFNPEFLREATAYQDFVSPDRQIIGFTDKSHDVANDILAILPKATFSKSIPATEVEMVKYFGNTFLATKVIFANQIYDLCRILGVDYNLVMECTAADPRIGGSHFEIFHQGYRGYGGACFPKDTKSFIQFGDKLGVELKLLKLVEEINNTLRELEEK